MTPNAKATAHQRVPVGRCGVALPVFPKNSQIFIIPRGIIPVNTVFEIKLTKAGVRIYQGIRIIKRSERYQQLLPPHTPHARPTHTPRTPPPTSNTGPAHAPRTPHARLLPQLPTSPTHLHPASPIHRKYYSRNCQN